MPSRIDRLTIWLYIPILFSLMAVQYGDGFDIGRALSIDLIFHSRWAWWLETSLAIMMLLVAIGHGLRLERTQSVLMTVCFVALVSALLLNPFLPQHDIAVVVLAIAGLAWVATVGAKCRSKGVLYGGVFVLASSPALSFCGLGLAEKELIVLFLATFLVLKRSRQSQPFVGFRIRWQHTVGVTMAIVLSTALSLGAAVKGHTIQLYLSVARDLSDSGVMTGFDGLRFISTEERIWAEPLTDEDLAFLRQRLYHPLNRRTETLQGTQIRILTAFRFPCRFNQAQATEMFGLSAPYLTSRDKYVRESAMRAVCHVYGWRALPYVKPLLKDPDPNVRKATRKKIDVILELGPAYVPGQTESRSG